MTFIKDFESRTVFQNDKSGYSQLYLLLTHCVRQAFEQCDKRYYESQEVYVYAMHDKMLHKHGQSEEKKGTLRMDIMLP